MGGAQQFDPRNPVHNMNAFVRLLGDASGERDAINWYKGAIFSVIGDDTANTHLCGVEGFSACRTVPQADGTFMNLQREVLYYTDRFTGKILDTWKNPFTDEEVRVVPVYNDPVNSIYAPEFKQKFGDDRQGQDRRGCAGLRQADRAVRQGGRRLPDCYAALKLSNSIDRGWPKAQGFWLVPTGRHVLANS